MAVRGAGRRGKGGKTTRRIIVTLTQSTIIGAATFTTYRHNDSLRPGEFRHGLCLSEAVFPHSWHALFAHSPSSAPDAQYILPLISRGLNA